MDVPWSSCIRLCVEIIRQLQTAHYNRKECCRLERGVSSVKQYLEQIQRQGLTPAGQNAEGHLQATLNRAHKHVTRFVSMHPVVCVIMARQLKEKFILLRSELMESFTVMHAGEHLSRATAPQPQAVELQDVQQVINEVLNNVLDEQDQRLSRMESAAQIAMRQGSSPESIQRVLLDQLKGLEGLDDMSAEELTTCLKELQVAVLYGLDEGMVKPLGSKTEEFLVDQLCQALQRQAVLQDTRQQAAPPAPSAPPEPPRGFLCPISYEIMVKPVMLMETGHTFERACIERWLDGHDTCPVSHRKLTQPPQLVTNYNLQQSIADWAQQQGYQLPPAPEYQRPFDLDARRDQNTTASVTSSSSSTTTTHVVQRAAATSSRSSSSSSSNLLEGVKSTLIRAIRAMDPTGTVQDNNPAPSAGITGALAKVKKTLEGHTRSVKCCAISPDGCTLVSGSDDRTLKVWDLGSGRCKQTLEGHTGVVTCCAISPDGRTLVSGSDDRTLKVWDLNSGKCRQTLKGHADWVRCCAISPDGSTLISGSIDTTLKVWYLGSGRCRQTLKEHTSWGRCCAFSPDELKRVSGSTSSVIVSDDSTLKVWDLGSGKRKQILKGHTGLVTCCAVSPDGRTLVSGSADTTLKVWYRGSGRCRQTLVGHTDVVYCCAISPDGSTLVSGGDDETLKVWDLSSRKCTQTLKGHTNRVWSCAISPDGRTLVSGSEDNTLKVWDLGSVAGV